MKFVCEKCRILMCCRMRNERLLDNTTSPPTITTGDVWHCPQCNVGVVVADPHGKPVADVMPAETCNAKPFDDPPRRGGVWPYVDVSIAKGLLSAYARSVQHHNNPDCLTHVTATFHNGRRRTFDTLDEVRAFVGDADGRE